MRCIFHVDMDAFYASIEQRDRPELRGVPVIVGGRPERRGVVSAASYEARRFGVHSAMPSGEALRRCPEGVFIPVRMDHYRAVSRDLMALLESFTPELEKLSVDEAFLDVSGSLRRWDGDPAAMARTLKQRVREELGLTASVGIAPNKFLAKLASDLDKPDGLTVTPREPAEVARWLAPMPVSRIWGVGRKTEARLRAAGIVTIGDLQDAEPGRLRELAGEAAAEKMSRLARGEDPREVETATEEKSISAETTFDRDINDLEELRQVLVGLAEKVGRRTRRGGWFAGTLQIKIRYHDFTTLTRQARFEQATHHDRELIRLALDLFERARINRSLRLLGVGVSQLVRDPAELRPAQGELDLFEADGAEGDPKQEALDEAVDRLRERFGPGSLKRGDWKR